MSIQRTPKSRVVVAALSLLILTVVVSGWCARAKLKVGYHIAQLKSEQRLEVYRSCPIAGVNRDYVFWTLAGRPTVAHLQYSIAHHQDALMKLGYFEQREFRLQNRGLDWHTQTELIRAFQTNKLSHWSTFMRSSVIMDAQRSIIRVMTIPEDMPTIAAFISRLDQSPNGITPIMHHKPEWMTAPFE